VRQDHRSHLLPHSLQIDPAGPNLAGLIAAVDTLEIAKRLKDAGFNDPQAEAITTIIRDAREIDLSQLATKSDLEILRRDLTIRLGGMPMFATGLLLAAKLFG